LKREDKLKLVEPSDEIKEAYFQKSANCLKSARVLLKNDLYENSISMSYYAMYNSLLALLYKTGIKCENHSGSILILKLLFEKEKLYQFISDAKKERIDKQYYVTSKDNIMKESTEELVGIAEEFVLKIKVEIRNLNNEYITKIRRKFERMVD